MAAPAPVPPLRHHLPRRLALAVTVGALILGLLAAVAPQRAAAAGPGVVVTLSGGTQQSLTGSQLTAAADVVNQQYAVRQGPSDPGTTLRMTGVSMRALLQAVGVAPSAVGFVQVTRADGSWSTLSGADLASPPPFADGLAPVVWDTGTDTRYLRPLRDAGDGNGLDNLETSATPLQIVVHSGPLLSVSANASPNPASAGTAVTFSAQSSGSGLTYAWDFGDGGSASGAQVTHSFSQEGVYRATVTVTGSGDAGGSAVAPVQVGAAPPQNATGPAGGSAPTGAPSGSRSGAKSGTTGGKKKAKKQTGTTRSGADSEQAKGTPTPVAAATPAPGAGSGAAAVTPAPATSAPASPSAAPARTPRPRASATPTATATPAPTPSAERLPVVRGVLLTAAVTAPRTDRGVAAVTANAAAREGGPTGVAVPLGVLAALAVAGAGAGVELRRRPR